MEEGGDGRTEECEIRSSLHRIKTKKKNKKVVEEEEP